MRIKQWFTIALSLLIPTCSFSADKLIFAIDLIRHGDRTPIQAIKTVNHQWTEGLGQLTAQGMQQEYEMGLRFRRRYIDETHLLPPHFQSDTIHVYATDYSRTLMSATSLLMGLYPPGTGPRLKDQKFALPNGFQPIPIHSAPEEVNYLIPRPIYSKIIPLFEKHVFSKPEWQAKEKQLKPKFKIWSQITGAKVEHLEDLKLLADSVYIYRLKQVPLPKELSEDDIQTILSMTKWIEHTEENSKEMQRYYTHDMTIAIADFLKTGSEKKSPLKYVLLSAHDTSIIRALTLLGATLPEWPPYASDLNFSLYENEKGEQHINVTLNGDAMTIPACGGTVCSLAQFKMLAQGHLERHVAIDVDPSLRSR